jgi:hypothetical protein
MIINAGTLLASKIGPPSVRMRSVNHWCYSATLKQTLPARFSTD